MANALKLLLSQPLRVVESQALSCPRGPSWPDYQGDMESEDRLCQGGRGVGPLAVLMRKEEGRHRR